MAKQKTYKSIWFTEDGMSCPIGIVIVYDPDSVNRAYIGTGLGIDQRKDEKRIEEYGAPFPLSEALRLIEDYNIQ